MTDQRDAVRRGYDAIAEEYLDQRSPDEAEIDLLADFSERLPTNARVLDAGCGAGDPVAARLAIDFSVAGMDISRKQLRLARENVPGAWLLQGDLTNLPFADNAFDGITSFHALIHVPTDHHSEVYEEFGRLVRPDGYVLVSVGNDAWKGTNPDWLETGVEMRWSFPDLETSLGLLSDAGFETVQKDTVGDELGGGAWKFVLARKREG